MMTSSVANWKTYIQNCFEYVVRCDLCESICLRSYAATSSPADTWSCKRLTSSPDVTTEPSSQMRQ